MLMKRKRLLERIKAGQMRNVRFQAFCSLLNDFGFKLVRQAGSHHIFTHVEYPIQLSLQEVSGEAKPYQVRQFLALVERYNLHRNSD